MRKRQCTKCKEEKPYNKFYSNSKNGKPTSHCRKCLNVKSRYKRTIKTKCIKCGSDKDPNSNSYCKLCSRINAKKLRDIKILRKDNLPNLKRFIEKINSQGGMATTEEVFIDLIDLYDIYGRESDVEMLSSNEQIGYMWRFLNDYYNKS